MTLPIVERLRGYRCKESYACDERFDEAANTIETLERGLQRIAAMTDIEADFDGFEARQIALDALAKIETPTLPSETQHDS